MKFISYFLSTLLIFFFITSCQKKEETITDQKKIKVITTLFPLYDFAKRIGQEKADVRLLLPPGVEAHDFEPSPADMRRIQNADIFIYTGSSMEPWVEKLLQSIDKKRLMVIDTSLGINLIKGHHEQNEVDMSDSLHQHDNNHSFGHKSHDVDPHIWLDFSNALKMVDTIMVGYIHRNPQNQDIYFRNANEYKKELERLDEKFKKTLSACKNRVIIHAGHFAFGYLAKRYDLKYISAYKGFTPDSEPTPKRIVEIIKTLKKYELKTIYYEELITPKVAETISKETGCNLLMIHGAHNISKEDMDRNVTFISLMDKNLENLRIGMQCP